MVKGCSNFLIEEFFSDTNPDFSYIEILSKGGLTIPSMNSKNHFCTAFAILDFTVTVILNSGLADQIAAKYLLLHILNSFESFTCKEKGRKFASRAINYKNLL